jgi:PAS domain S-box-containing protein
MNPHDHKRRSLILFLSGFVVLLLIMAVIPQAFNLNPLWDSPGRETTLLLWALTSLNVILLVSCSLVLLRHLLKLYFERRTQQLGSKFRTKLVFAFLGLSFIPVIFMSCFAYLLLNRAVDKWFSRPIDQVVDNAERLVRQVRSDSVSNAIQGAKYLADHPAVKSLLAAPSKADVSELAGISSDFDISMVLFLDQFNKPLFLYKEGKLYPANHPDFRRIASKNGLTRWEGGKVQLAKALVDQVLGGGKDATLTALDEDARDIIFAGNVVSSSDSAVLAKIVVAYRIPGDMLKLANEFSQSSENYLSWASRNERLAIRWNYVLWLGLITLLILFFAVWVGLYLSKKITIPIRALAEAANEVSRGNLLHRVNCPADDELGILVSSFNRMTTQLSESSKELEQTNRNLQSSNQALEEKRRYTEAILEHIPTGVISVTPDYHVNALNKAAESMFGYCSHPGGFGIEDLFQPEDVGEIRSLLDKASRVGVAAKDLYLRLSDKKVYCAVTISSLKASDAPSQGFVMVLEDLTEVLKAQKANAWREVARRMAHEIKNPLTPIQLSAERILKNHVRMKQNSFLSIRALDGEYERMLSESVQTITQEVTTLKSMVDEFSRFARLPAASLISCNLNSIIENALSSYNGRFQDIRVTKGLSPSLPEIKLDPEQFRRVLVNLIDNALEAMDLSPVKELSIFSSFYPQKETVQVVVRDTGQGIASADKEKLFLPYFSTRKHGTGLGLAIVSRIVADHKGFIHVEDNIPTGASFVIEIPTR